MGKASRRKKLRRQLGKGAKGDKIGTSTELIDDIEKFQRRCSKAVKEKARLTVLHNPDPVVKEGVKCDSCTAIKGCCRQAVYADLYEGLPIARRLSRKGLDTPALREQLFRRAKEMEGTSREAWLDRMVPCVFLTENERCSIYAYRPTACRTHLVFSDPARCSAPTGQKIYQVDTQSLIPQQAKMSRGVHEALGLEETLERSYMCSLPRAVWTILEFWGRKDFVDRINTQPWPSLANIASWMNGDNPYGNRR